MIIQSLLQYFYSVVTLFYTDISLLTHSVKFYLLQAYVLA